VGPALEGEYERTSEFDDFMEQKRPVYVRVRALPRQDVSVIGIGAEKGGVGGGGDTEHESVKARVHERTGAEAHGNESVHGANTTTDSTQTKEVPETAGQGLAQEGEISQIDTVLLVCYFWKFSKVSVGWWFGTKFGCKKNVVGYNPSVASKAPRSGWQMLSEGRRQARGAEFLTKQQLVKKVAPPVERVLKELDLEGVMGTIHGPDSHSSDYFGHFNALLHLEFLVELEGMRRRVMSRRVDELQKTGWALAKLSVDRVFIPKFNKFKEAQGPRITFVMPAGVAADRLKFKKGDGVLLSRTHPLQVI